MYVSFLPILSGIEANVFDTNPGFKNVRLNSRCTAPERIG